MTFEQWLGKNLPTGTGFYHSEVTAIAALAWRASALSARADVAAEIWEHRGKCVSDAAAEALMEVVRGMP